MQPSYTHKSVDECASLCLIHESCQAFEYGVNYKGDGKATGYCSLQDGTDRSGCDGSQHNYDLYVKKGMNPIDKLANMSLKRKNLMILKSVANPML